MKIDPTLFLQNLKDLRNFITRQNSVDKGDDEDFYIQEQLDKLNYYVKHISKDSDNIFKAISDCLHFTISNWQHEKTFMEQSIQHSLETGDDDYNISGLVGLIDKNSLLTDPETTLLLACYFYGRNLKLLGFDDSCSLEELNLDLGFTECFIMSIIDTDSNKNDGPKNDTTSVTAYDNLYSKEYISKARFCQKLLNKILDASLRGISANLNNTVEIADSFELDPDEEEPDIMHANFGNRSLNNILEQSDEESHGIESEYNKHQDMDESDESFEDDDELDDPAQTTIDTTRKDSSLEKSSKQVGETSTTVFNKLNKNAKIFKPKTLKKTLTQSSNVSENSANYHDVQNSPQLPQYGPEYGTSTTTPPQPPQMSQQAYTESASNFSHNMGYPAQYQQVPSLQPIQQVPVQANYMVSQTHGIPKFESGMLISYHSSSMMGVIQSIPSGEQVYVEIGELSSMGIGIDFLYNLARIRLMCSFQKKYVYDQTYSLRPTATNMKIISIDVVQS
jgi:hypothetical protein